MGSGWGLVGPRLSDCHQAGPGTHRAPEAGQVVLAPSPAGESVSLIFANARLIGSASFIVSFLLCRGRSSLAAHAPARAQLDTQPRGPTPSCDLGSWLPRCTALPSGPGSCAPLTGFSLGDPTPLTEGQGRENGGSHRASLLVVSGPHSLLGGVCNPHRGCVFIDFRERRGGERETSTDCLRYVPPPGLEPTTWTCALPEPGRHSSQLSHVS